MPARVSRPVLLAAAALLIGAAAGGAVGATIATASVRPSSCVIVVPDRPQLIPGLPVPPPPQLDGSIR